MRLSRALPLLTFPLLFTLARPAHAARSGAYLFLAGLNLSSPRTASNISLASFTTPSAGLGYDLNAKEHLNFEADLLYLGRRYGYAYTLPTLLVPFFLQYESNYFFAGAGPYIGVALSASADDGVQTSLDRLSMSSIDLGAVAHMGVKLPLTSQMSGFGEFRMARALTASVGGPVPFYWGEIQIYGGLRIRSKSR